jgi:PKHD-type hydroxylase|tara:strand:- start:126 stop:695 length:570 start_codon:yes stop_codon:yes gene_type:complete
MKQNNNFQFVIHRDNFLSKTQCDNIIKLFDENKTSSSELAGEYNGSLLNKNVRDAKEIIFEDDYIKNKIKMVLELANLSIYKYNIQELEDVKLLKYNIGGKYKWHTDVGSKETSTRKLTAIVQLSDEQDYEGGDLEFGITDELGENNYVATKKQGSIIVFPSFLSHRVIPITKGTRYSLLTWMNGDSFV